MTVRPWDEMQLKFDLPGLDEVQEDADLRQISPEQARMISEAAKQKFDHRDTESTEKTPNWFDDYMLLVEQGWPWRVAAYIAWAGSPRVGRWPETLEKLATEVLGLTSSRAISNWRRKYPSIDGVVSMMLSKPLFDHRADVFRALVDMAKTPDYKAFNDRKLFLEITGDYVPKSKLQVSGSAKDLSELSDEELDRLIGEELQSNIDDRKEHDLQDVKDKNNLDIDERDEDFGEWKAGI